MGRIPRLICIIGILIATPAFATDYHVGPGQTFATIGAVPWYTLAAGDTVYIHYATYHEKFLISTRGTVQQPIRVVGVLDANGHRPVIDGENATTSANNHHHWLQPNLVQWLGVVFVSINADAASLPEYIEIKNLEIKNGYKTNKFTAENGNTIAYNGFAAGIYIRSAQHILIENCVIHDNGQGIYDWSGSGSNWWDGLSKDITLRGNFFYNNGQIDSYNEHQTYTEADGVIIENNHYGPQRSGALGSQLKDRSAGTVIRYNYIEQSPRGWDLDLVEPQQSYDYLHTKPSYKQTFVYGNIIINKGVQTPNMIHWNEDSQSGHGRATLTGGKLFFYNNTIITVANQSDMGWNKGFLSRIRDWDNTSSKYNIFNVTYGAYDCPPGILRGVIDVRNNIFVSLPRTVGSTVPHVQFGYCGRENFNFGKNWVSPGYVVHGATVTGTENLVTPASNDPGLVDVFVNDVHLLSTSSAIGIGGALAPEVTSNSLGLNLTPRSEYVYHQQIKGRLASGIGLDAGAFEYTGNQQ